MSLSDIPMHTYLALLQTYFKSSDSFGGDSKWCRLTAQHKQNTLFNPNSTIVIVEFFVSGT